MVTTPNVNINTKFPTLHAGQFCHEDHRFEWTRLQFQDWTAHVAERYGYTVRCRPVGPWNDEVGVL